MSQFDFNKEVNRRNTSSLKWDVAENELPMWVADMDFAIAPAIENSIKKRLDEAVFGYSIVPDEWYDSYINWWNTRHNFKIEKDWLIFSTGVVPSISSIVRKITTPGEKVLVQTPCYNIFFNSIVNNGRFISEAPLTYQNGQYSINWEDLEAKLSDPQTSLFILCNPHNPVGKIWDLETLQRIGELCLKYNVTVLSDEIHCDITLPNTSYIPFAKASETCKKISITCIAASKAFNIAGFQSSAVFIADPFLRHKVNRGLNTDEVAEPNAFAICTTIAAFNESADWLDALREHLANNRKQAQEFIVNNNLPLKLVNAEATYLLWIDCSAFTDNTNMFCNFLRKKTGLYISKGASYGACGKTFIRVNIACTEKTLKDGLERLKTGVKQFIAQHPKL